MCIYTNDQLLWHQDKMWQCLCQLNSQRMQEYLNHYFMFQVEISKNKDWFVESWNRHRAKYSTANDTFVLNRSLAVICGLFALFFEQTCAHQCLCDSVRIAVSGWATVLEVTFLVLPHWARNADAGPTVGHAGWELINARGFVTTSETSGVVEPTLGIVGPDVIPVSFCQLFNGFLDDSEDES